MESNRAPVVRKGSWRCAIPCLFLCVLLLGASASEPHSDAVPSDGAQLLRDAFARRYGLDFTSEIELVMRNSLGQELRRQFHVVSKTIDGRVHSVGRLVWPEYLRGMAILTIEAENRGHDAFLYLPSLAKVRRVTTAQRADSFLGSDVTYEDLERQRAQDYVVESLEAGAWEGEETDRVRAKPLRDYSYAAVEFEIARADHAILVTRYFKRDQDEPYRLIIAPREDIVSGDGHLFPSRLTVQSLRRGSSTEVFFRQLKINPSIDDRVFSIGALEQHREIGGDVSE